MSATIDTALFSSYFGNCPIIEIFGRTFPVQEYFLEDIVQMCDYCPDSTALAKKRKKRNPGTSGADDDDDDDDDDMGGGMGDDGEKEDRDVDCNTIVSNDYSEKTKNIMAQLSEKSIPFDMIECLLKYIRSLSIPGSVLVFLPGWNLIQSILKFLQQHPLFGSNQYILLPLHSQIPREDQYKVFLDAPPGKSKIILSTNIAESTITINDVVFVIDRYYFLGNYKI
jgi:ATP-dependent RNA helicase A